MTLKTLLDDAAAEATRDLRIDLGAVRRRADDRRREVRRKAASVMATVVAVAATILLAVALLPGTGTRAVQPAAGPTGIPERWFYSPEWAPPVTRHPMAAASMMLSTNLNTDFGWNEVPGVVLVSADGKQYASLPWSIDDGLATLSRDGTRAAWVTQPAGRRPTVHQLVLATGERRDDRLLGTAPMSQLVWAGHRLYGTRETRTMVFATNRSTVLTDCVNPPLSSDVRGRLLTPVPKNGCTIPETVPNPELYASEYTVDNPRVTGKAVSSPDGTRVAVAVHDDGGQWFVSQGAGALTIRMQGTDPVTRARVLAWGPAGILVRTTTTNPTLGSTRSLRLYDPAGDAFRVVAKPSNTNSDVLAVADDLVTGSVPGVRPEISATDRSHVRWLIGRGWSVYGDYLRGAALALILLLAGMYWWRTGHRRQDALRDEPAHAPGGAGPAGDGG